MRCERATNLSTPFQIELDFESVQLDKLVIIKKNLQPFALCKAHALITPVKHANSISPAKVYEPGQ